MVTLSALTLYPVKSCAGLDLASAVLTRAGLRSGAGPLAVTDREWMVVDASGRFLTQRELPRMALIRPVLDGPSLLLHAPDCAPLALPLVWQPHAPTVTVHIWDESLSAADCGDTAAAWLARLLGTPCRLVRFDPARPRLTSTRWTGGIAAPTLFSDGYPVLLAGAASLADLNHKLQAAGRAPLPMDRFRPNLVLDGLDAFEEDYIDTLTVGGATLKPVKPCPRCPIPSVDQQTGLVGPDPLDLMQSYRSKPALDGALCFGMNCIVLDGDGLTLSVGQQIDVELAF
jgi:uncharacterized protein YcbX